MVAAACRLHSGVAVSLPALPPAVALIAGVTFGWYRPESGLGGAAGAGMVVVAWIATGLALGSSRGSGRSAEQWVWHRSARL